MAGQTEHHDLSEGGRTPDAVLALTRRLLAELHPGVAWIPPITLDSALEQDLGLDSLSRVELAVRIERACAATLPEQALGGALTLRDLLNALQVAPRASSAATDAARPARWSEPAQAVPEDAETLIETLAWHARAHPDRVHIVHLGDSGETNISYADPQREVDIVATGLQRASLEPRRTAAIMLPTCPEHLHTYFGIPRADGSPVPMFPPARPSQIEQHVRRHAGILCNAETSVLVTVPEARGVARQLEGRVPGLRRVAPGAELKDYGREPLPVPIGRDDIAFIQYISGSTGDHEGLDAHPCQPHGPKSGRDIRPSGCGSRQEQGPFFSESATTASAEHGVVACK